MKLTWRSLVVLALFSLPAFAQPAARPQADRDLKGRINAVSRKLNDDLKRDLADREWDMRLASAAAAIRADVTRFIEAQARPGEPATVIEARLRGVFADQEPIDEDSDPPTARVAQLRNGRSLVTWYTVARPAHADTAEIYAFHDNGGRFRLAATTASEDFDGYSLFVREVPSPLPGVMYLLAGGHPFGANGPVARFRLYTFDGATFSTLWQPEDVFDGSVTVTPKGFTIKRMDRTRGEYVRESYETTVNGVVSVQ